MTRFMAQIPGRPTQVGSALQAQSLTIAETPHSHQIKLPACSICSHRLGKNVKNPNPPPRVKPTRGAPTFLNVSVYSNSRILSSIHQWTPSTGRNRNEPGPSATIVKSQFDGTSERLRLLRYHPIAK